MKFAHLGDCHLGGWRQPELRTLNFQSFQEAVARCIKKKVEFALIAGDLFDSPYPPIETLKNTFAEFRKLKDAKIPVFIIAGSHDYSVSGKTFLDVLEKAGFCKNVSKFAEKNSKIFLEPTLYKNIAIYGFSGKKSGMEVEEIERIKIQDSPGLFKILMLHTTIRDAIGNVPVKAVDEKSLPKVDYLALSHLHINYVNKNIAYSGPTFPNNLSELEELQGGSFCVFNNGRIEREQIKIKEVVPIHLEINNSLTATEKILDFLKDKTLKDKIVIVRVSGILEKGKIVDVDFNKIESFAKERGAYTFLKSTSKLHMQEPELKFGVSQSENLEEQIIKQFMENNPNKFNSFINELMKNLSIEKQEDETHSAFEDRLLTEIKNSLSLK